MNQPYKASDAGKDSDEELQAGIQTAECVRELGAVFMAGSPGTGLGYKRFNCHLRNGIKIQRYDTR